MISMVDCYAISHLFVYIIKYKYTNESLTLNLKGLCTWNGVFLCVLERNSKIVLRDTAQRLHNFVKIW